MKLPKARTDVLVQDLKDEVLIYDKNKNKSYCLNSTAKTVFNACDGTTTLEDLKHQSSLPDDVIYLSLDEIKRNDLIEESYVSPFAGVSRREVIKRVGLASMVALPVIFGLIAPTAANAQSGCVADGQPGSVTTVSNANMFECQFIGYPDPACCNGFARGIFIDGTCTNIVCNPGVPD